ncbi:CR1 protein, partial [Atrichornis clamosus]|nr:CR1 protein [Atrichornis clamosus]
TVGVCGTGSWLVRILSPPVVPPCPSPPNIRNGQHHSKGVKEFIPGMSVKYYCDLGYVLTGKTTVSCLPSGSWSIPYPRCEVLQCPPPPNIDKGNHSSQDVEVFTPGMVVNYSCDPGYSLLGEASIYCTPSGNWSLPLPQC